MKFTIYFIVNDYILSLIILKPSKNHFLQEISIHYALKNIKMWFELVLCIIL